MMSKYEFYTKKTFQLPQSFWKHSDCICARSLRPKCCGDIGDVRKVSMLCCSNKSTNLSSFLKKYLKNLF